MKKLEFRNLEIKECIDKDNSSITYYTIINKINGTHVHAVYISSAIQIAKCYSRLIKGLPVDMYSQNVRNKTLKLLGYNILY